MITHCNCGRELTCPVSEENEGAICEICDAQLTAELALSREAYLLEAEQVRRGEEKEGR